MQLLSNELKAVAVMADMTETADGITSDQCMSVQHFDYRCARKRDAKGRTYKASEPTMLHFSVRLNSTEQARTFFKQLTDSEYGNLSFVFNLTFSETGRLKDYDNAMVVEGYLVDLKEDFYSAEPMGQEEQMMLNASMLVRAITYLEQNDRKTLCFIYDK